MEKRRKLKGDSKKKTKKKKKKGEGETLFYFVFCVLFFNWPFCAVIYVYAS